MSNFFASIWSAAAAVLIWLGLMSPPAPPSFQGYVEGEFVLVSPTVGGQLVTLSVARGEHVEGGAQLFALDQADEKAARDQAAAMLAQAQDRLSNLAKGKRQPEIAVIAAQKAQAEAQVRLAQLDLDRQKKLIGSAAFMKQQFDSAQANFDQQTNRVAELTAQLQVAEIPLGRDDELRAAVGDVSANQAALTQAQWKLDQKTLAAPTASLVADTYFNPGEMINAGQAVVSLLPPGNIKVRFFVPQEALAQFAIGARLNIHCDGCARDIPGTVRFVSPQAEYTPPVLYNRENRNRLVFMIEAYPTATPEALRPGQPVDVVLAAPK
ncbi:MAG: HlyD family secretion protein [Stellaceae bacterium]